MKRKTGILKTVSALFFAAAGLFLFPLRADAAISAEDQAIYRSVFDAEYYSNAYPDVVAVYGTDEAALFQHFLNTGALEGRDASAEFNPLAYRQRYPDLKAALGNNLAKYCVHYTSCGKAEGRDGSSKGIALVPDPSAVLTSREVLGSYTTMYKPSIPRATNVRLAAERINGVVIQPGESFSYSNTILPRTRENGYVEATVIVNKEYTTGLGGGICQVSSTLYAAMLSVGLPATERHPHSLPVTYLPEGMDATISGTALDLKFNNIYSSPLMIRATAEKGVLTVSLVLVYD